MLTSQLTVYFRARENEKSRSPPLPHLSIPGAHMDGYVDARGPIQTLCPYYSVTTHGSAAA